LWGQSFHDCSYKLTFAPTYLGFVKFGALGSNYSMRSCIRILITISISSMYIYIFACDISRRGACYHTPGTGRHVEQYATCCTCKMYFKPLMDLPCQYVQYWYIGCVISALPIQAPITTVAIVCRNIVEVVQSQ